MKRVSIALAAVLASSTALLLGSGSASADRLLQQRRVDFARNGAYGIVHYGVANDGHHYLRIYVHDTRPDRRCAEVWADFLTEDLPGRHRHIDPTRAIICGNGRRAWSRQFHVRYNDGRGLIRGIRWVDACWRTRNGRDCARERADNNSYIRRGKMHNIPLRR